MATNFVGMTLTQIFELPQLQSLLLKFWYLGLTCEHIVVPQEEQYFKMIKKTINFANCFTFEMPAQMYYSLLDRIAQALGNLNCQKILTTIVNYMKVNKLGFISFEIFGLHFLQLFGKVLESLNQKIMGKIIRSVFIAISDTDKLGKVSLKANRQSIVKVDLDQYIADLRWKIMDSPEEKNEQSIVQRDREEKLRTSSFPKVNTLQGRMDIQKFYAKEGRLDKPEGGSYPVGEKMRNKEKASLSSYMVGGFEIVDYSDSINQLHKKLLSKILLNR